ncbi:hypothetical protein A2U01_0113403, partial [Trifolium medium]|nr:hypothetical protein [Trifolium medium]
MGDMFLVV